MDTLIRAVRQTEERNLYTETLPLLAALLDVLGPDDQRWLEVLAAMTWRADWVVDHLVASIPRRVTQRSPRQF